MMELWGDSRLPERFWDKVRSDANGCWLWTASCFKTGYAQYRHDNTTHRAHRVAYRVLVGEPPVDLPDLDHLCRVRHCVNPAHLEPVTRRENSLRGVNLKMRAHREQKCLRGHPYEDNRRTTPSGHNYCILCNAATARAWKERHAA